ncbi:hypothetical protein CDAR_67191 [Caerostris darwini]|uniref:Uncharacterized protein n=1 Tax=Caerostris darwini TaxID=1538125 RepID=A0AAV4TXT4_9ARAC|nr:hypothetical protein CDAR_67191 [Caerostris darwini]
MKWLCRELINILYSGCAISRYRSTGSYMPSYRSSGSAMSRYRSSGSAMSRYRSSGSAMSRYRSSGSTISRYRSTRSAMFRGDPFAMHFHKSIFSHSRLPYHLEIRFCCVCSRLQCSTFRWWWWSFQRIKRFQAAKSDYSSRNPSPFAEFMPEELKVRS